MSFLNNVRLVFSGRFQADVSTVNNDVRHFDNATFEPAFQEFQTKEAENGWWNPTGSGAFRLLDCKVVAVHYADGTSATSARADPALGMRIAGSDDRTSGKIVDIDPQWQLASALWGLEVRLTDGNESGFFAGHYRPHAFRDLWFGRMLNASGSPGGGDGSASATFQSVLHHVKWAKHLNRSRALAELHKAASTGLLSIRLTTFGYIDRPQTRPDFTLGMVTGAIGPHLESEPESFVLGRRFAPANGTTSWNGCSYCSGRVDRANRRLFIDLSNGLQLAFPNEDPTQEPLVPIGTLNNIGALQAGILKNPDAVEFTPATKDNFLPIGAIDYLSDGWLLKSSGIVSLPLSDKHLRLIGKHPLALAAKTALNAGTGANGEFGQIAIRETTGGLLVGAEPLVHRIDAPGSSQTTIHAAHYGAPLAGAAITISQFGLVPNQGGSANPSFPPAPIPDIGVPEDRFQLPASLKTDANGEALLRFKAQDPGNPRRYIDGQLYLVDFRLPGQGNQARSQFDYIVVHVRDAFAAPSDPSWNDVQPILLQYGNLYPIMSHGIVDMGNPADVKRHARILRLAFSLEIGNPNYMPVTRDLSAGKRDMILRYLDKLMAQGDAALEKAIASAAPVPPRTRIQPPAAAVEHPGGKTTAARALRRALGRGPE
jgi:hypothetical protein